MFQEYWTHADNCFIYNLGLCICYIFFQRHCKMLVFPVETMQIFDLKKSITIKLFLMILNLSVVASEE